MQKIIDELRLELEKYKLATKGLEGASSNYAEGYIDAMTDAIHKIERDWAREILSRPQPEPVMPPVFMSAECKKSLEGLRKRPAPWLPNGEYFHAPHKESPHELDAYRCFE